MHGFFMTKVIFLSLLIILLLAGGLRWFIGNRQAAPKSYVGPAEKIAIGNIGEFTIFNLISTELGYFANHGLDAEVYEYNAGPAAIGDLLSGKVDVATAADFVGVTNIFKHPELRIISEASRHNVFNVIARVDHGIVSPTDLKGKKIGVTRKSAGEFYLGRFLLLNDLSLSDVTVLDMTPEIIVAELEASTIDAAVTFNPHIYNLEKKLGDKIVVWSAQGPRKTFATIYSTRDYIQSHPKTIEVYLRALLDAETYLNANPAEAKALLARVMGYSPEYTDYNWKNFKHTISLDQELLLSMEDQARWLIKNGLVEDAAVPNYLDYIYFSALSAVGPERVRVIY